METLSFVYFEGSAGTGKTHSLIAELTSLLKRRPLRDGQRVSGMTYMHGARRRLHARLQEVQGLRGKFLCTTFDSFARRLLRRWRTLVRELNPQVDGLAVTDFETVCEHAAGLLCNRTVREWVAQAYPIVLVDELQDIKQSRLRIIRELAKSVFLVAAADEFQDLFNIGANEAIAWARSACKPVQLTNCYRTAQAGLLKAARLVRSGEAVPQKIGSEFQILQAPNPNVAASFIASNFHRYGASNCVIISPTGPNKSVFVRDAVKRVVEAPIKPKQIGKQIGPYRIAWEADQEAEERSLFSALVLQGDAENVISISQLSFPDQVRGARSVKESLERRRRLTGQFSFTVGEIKAEGGRILQQLRSRAGQPTGATPAMKIHQAKNREFDNVIVLWPYQVTGTSAESLRRLLYNGITRAKLRALVIVQCLPKQTRLFSPPFAP